MSVTNLNTNSNEGYRGQSPEQYLGRPDTLVLAARMLRIKEYRDADIREQVQSGKANVPPSPEVNAYAASLANAGNFAGDTSQDDYLQALATVNSSEAPTDHLASARAALAEIFSLGSDE